MPKFDYSCGSCGSYEDIVTSSESVSLCPRCGRESQRQFSPTRNIIVPEYMKAGATTDDHKRWLQSDDTKKQINDGTLIPYSEFVSRNQPKPAI